jgi:hypothetical protein
MAVPTFKITSNPVFPITYIEERRFDLIARGLNLGKAEMVAAENAQMFSLIDAVSKDENDIPFGPDFLTKTRDKLSNRGVMTVLFVFVHPYDYTKILKLKDKVRLDCNYVEKSLKTGLMGGIGNTDIYQSRSVPEGYMYVTGKTEATKVVDGTDDGIYAGYVVDKVRLNMLSLFDDLHINNVGHEVCYPGPFFGFSISEESGFAVNPAAVQRVSMKEWKDAN